MPLTLEQYATSYLDSRGLPWPAAPAPERVKAKPHLKPLKVRAVLWTAYGTLLAVPGGELAFEHSIDFVMDAALEKTIQEFKMWQSMSRKPGAPSAYMKELYSSAYTKLKLTGGGGEKYPEVVSEKIWNDIVKKLQQKEYSFDVVLYGSMDEFLQKLAYFFHASIQGCGAYPNAAYALKHVSGAGLVQGLLADGQSFTPTQITKGCREQEPNFELNDFIPADLRFLSATYKARKPSRTLFRVAIDTLNAKGIRPQEILHVGSSLERDLFPAKQLGMKTALYAGDKNSINASPDKIKEPDYRPDVLLTDLNQISDIVV